ncbi:aminotransferase-like domain-containing protein [Phaeobacter gallaeciensis]|uniref:Transcriptional regulator n=1 Tax=Phaeobacter gallaeciensis TaxID=60890 RepID=A0AAC9Z9Q1_9RHOB|nr:PLP-dependent aminotransferase family protein [Phaeobacter gallaeciensis]AHD10559.1 Transcriptional regulator [Phaeobacter gallaeciensis DSM 26640]ATE93822.1 Transcriptional regulator [Phaeobacter gallaeciensis]ATE96357.1 Transcriptional regulator [Phaeobacter gallaeciensis]ATF02486.1 Transcriptional regulator [Phaeobacter gallaeciensis]ATF06866.1 Transcriptional regulator [Phaeobacter gallaeciensis]
MTYLTPHTIPLSRAAAALQDNPLRALYPLAARDGMISLANGHPSPDACDHFGLRNALDAAAADPMAWRYGPTAGDPRLRRALADLSGAQPDNVILTSGAQQGIDLAVRTLCDPGDTVLVPEALYPATLSVLTACGVTALPVSEDTDGLCLEALDQAIQDSKARVLYLTPTFGNPTGSVLSEDHRGALLALCARMGVSILEDDPYRDLWFAVPPPPSLWEMAGDRGARVIAFRSCSKSIAPGLRIGWMLAPHELAPHLTAMKQASDLQSSGTAQMVALTYLSSGRFDDWLIKVRALYRRRHDALQTGLVAAGFDAPAVTGGMFLWAQLPKQIDMARLFESAVAQGVLYAPGAAFAASSPDGEIARYARFCFASNGLERLKQATDRLADAVRLSAQ